MPVVYRGANQSVLLGLTNGAFAHVEGWDLQPDGFGNLTPKGVVLRFADDASWNLTELPNSCLPVLPAVSSFTFAATEAGADDQTVQRRQLPIQPGFAMTVHSAQGITSTGPIIVDLGNGGFEAYVAASRATRRSDIFLLKPVTVHKLNSPPLPIALRAELQRLAQIAIKTKDKHDNTTWRVDSRSQGPHGQAPGQTGSTSGSGIHPGVASALSQESGRQGVSEPASAIQPGLHQAPSRSPNAAPVQEPHDYESRRPDKRPRLSQDSPQDSSDDDMQD
ncbi:hypothetical protein CF326_g8925 [Tilletia indica]|nr:hypothetical protein CF326_g8925 [Tilletia indica]